MQIHQLIYQGTKMLTSAGMGKNFDNVIRNELSISPRMEYHQRFSILKKIFLFSIIFFFLKLNVFIYFLSQM